MTTNDFCIFSSNNTFWAGVVAAWYGPVSRLRESGVSVQRAGGRASPSRWLRRRPPPGGPPATTTPAIFGWLFAIRFNFNSLSVCVPLVVAFSKLGLFILPPLSGTTLTLCVVGPHSIVFSHPPQPFVCFFFDFFTPYSFIARCYVYTSRSLPL